MMKAFDEELIADDSSSDSDDNEEKELEQQANNLETALSENKYLYDTHVELIRLYKQLGDLTSMRLAYERFKVIYPLTPTLWLNWLKDEIALSTTDEQKRKILALFQEATEDYLSVDLWLEYIQFAIGFCPVEETRSIIENGLTAAGLHVEKGSLLWDSLLAMELAHLSITDAESEKFKEQLSRVIDVYKRKLSIPLLNMEVTTYKEWKDFIAQLDDDDSIDTKAIDWKYNNALKTLEKYKPFEDRLLTVSEDELYDVFKEYISSVKDPAVILCLYERAVEKLCLRSDLWMDYCKYALKLGDIAEKVSKRALRNVTWCEELWVLRLKILEKCNQTSEDIMQCFELGLSSVQGGKQLWIAYLSYTQRNNEENLSKLFDQCEQVLHPDADPQGQIALLHARICMKEGDLDGARRLFKKISELPVKSDPCFWVDVINFERQHGDDRSLRLAYTRAAKFTNSSYIIDQWATYELMQDCDVDNLMKCWDAVRKINETQASQVVSAVNTNNKRKIDSDERTVKKPKIAQVEKQQQQQVEVRNKRPEVTRRNQGMPSNLDPTKSVFISNISPTVTAKHLNDLFPKGKVTLATDNKAVSRCFAYIQFETNEEAEEALKRDREPFESRPIFISKCKLTQESRQESFKYSTSLENTKLFVRGLPVSYTKQDVENIFKPYNFTDLRMVTHRSGQFKGLAYVDFANIKDTERALKGTDQMVVNNFTISVAISNPPRKGPTAGGSTNNQSQAGSSSTTTSVNLNHPKNRLQIPLVPRAVQVKNNTASPSDNKSGPPKSNADFRAMLLKK